MQMRRGLPPNVSPMLPEGYQGYEGYGAQPPRPVQSVQEILSQPLGEPTPNLSGVSGSASRQREIADLLMQGVQNQDNTSIAGGLSQLGQAFLARGARKKADSAEAKRDEVASLLMQQALGGDRNAMAQIMPVADILARDDRKERYGVEDEFTRTQLAQGQQGLDLQGRGVNLQERGLDHTITQDQFSNDLRGRELDLNAELGRGGLGVDRGRLDLQKSQFELEKEQAAAEAEAGGTYGLNVVWGMDGEGNYVPMQAGKSGGLIASQMPEGVTPLGPYGTAFDTASGKEQAKRAAFESTAGQALLGFESKADELVSQIDQAIEKSDFWNTGVTGAAVWSPDFNAILDSIGAKAMLSELVSIKAQGGTFGALSDAEGKALRDAAVNITKSQSEAQLDKNLQAYRDQVEKTRANMRKAFEDEYVNSTPNKRTPPGTGAATGGGAGAEQTATNPQTGEKLVLRNGQWVPVR